MLILKVDDNLCLNFFQLVARNPNLERKKIIKTNSFSLVRIQFYLSQALGKWVTTKTEMIPIPH